MTLNIQTFLQQHHHQTIVVGFSGGVDSVVLLHLLARARDEYGLTVRAVHVHHGLSEYADEWVNFCINLCSLWEIPLQIKMVTVKPDGLGIEAAARAARYAAFRELSGDCLALAHHRDDQVETFLLAALRGAGVRGLAAMAEQSFTDGLNVVRPILHVSRQQIQQYAVQHHLQFIEDESNFNSNFLRSWLRHDWLPALYQRLPHADRHIMTAIDTLQDELSIINEMNQLDEEKLYSDSRFRISLWRALSSPRRRQQLLRFAKRHDLGTPRHAGVLNFERVLLNQQHGAQWQLPDGQAVAYRDILFPLSKGWEDEFLWRAPQSGRLEQWAAAGDLSLQNHRVGLPAGALAKTMVLRTVQSGDVLPMKTGSKSVKKLLQQCGVPPFLRAYYPVLADEGGVIWAVVGLAVNQQVAVAGGVLPVSEHLARFLIKSPV